MKNSLKSVDIPVVSGYNDSMMNKEMSMTKPVYKCSVCGAKIATSLIRQCRKCIANHRGL
jgi:hypothetical protein